MARYQIWDKTSNVITPIGEFLTAEQWIARYPAAAHIKYVVAGGEVNGAFCSPFGGMIEHYQNAGCDFTNCDTDQDYLDTIEAFEDAQNTPDDTPTAEERIAAAMEYQVMASLPDETK